MGTWEDQDAGPFASLTVDGKIRLSRQRKQERKEGARER